MKWYKFGFTRLWHNLSIEIRNDRISREKAIKIVRDKGEELPEQEIKSFCNYLDIKENKFFEIVSKFRNRKIWKKNESGVWYIENFLINDWKWS